MISFTEIHSVNPSALSSSLGLSPEDGEYLGDVYSAFLGVSEEMGVEVALAAVSGCLAVRIFDEGRYLFPLPVALCDDADLRAVCAAVAEYSRRELLPLYFSDVPREELSMLSELFTRIDARAYDTDEDLFGVSVVSECGSLEDVPSVTLGDITLDALSESDKDAYAALCRDRSLNKWWGYDADEDNPEHDPDLYLKVARDELAAGVALTLAVRRDGVFVGEAVVYDFDYTGGAAIGIRILPTHQGGGVGSRTLEALLLLCRDIGLSRIRTSVMAQNLPSVGMTDKYMTRTGESQGKIFYSLDL